MDLIKYSPKWKELERIDPDAVKMMIGYIKKVRKGNHTPYVLLKIIMKYWGTAKSLKLMLLSKRYHPWIFKSRLLQSELDASTELSEISTTHRIKKIQYKIILSITNVLNIHIYPFSGTYATSKSTDTKTASRQPIFTQFNSKWALNSNETKDLRLNVIIYKSTACLNSKCSKKEAGSYIQLRLRGSDLIEGEIQINVSDLLFQSVVGLSLNLITWDQEIEKEGYTVCKECSECSRNQINRNGWVFVE